MDDTGGGPRIVAWGTWRQNEHGDTTYVSTGTDPVPRTEEEQERWAADLWARKMALAEAGVPAEDPAVLSGALPPRHERGGEDRGWDEDDRAPSRVRPDAVWARARADFIAGDTARAVCDRHGLALGTLKERAKKEGWRRRDLPPPDLDDGIDDDGDDLDLRGEAVADAPDYAVMAAQALSRSNRALKRGRAAEAGSWLRMHRSLKQLIAEEAKAQAAAAARDGASRPAPALSRAQESRARLNLVAGLTSLTADLAAVDRMLGPAPLRSGKPASAKAPASSAPPRYDDDDWYRAMRSDLMTLALDTARTGLALSPNAAALAPDAPDADASASEPPADAPAPDTPAQDDAASLTPGPARADASAPDLPDLPDPVFPPAPSNVEPQAQALPPKP